MAPPVSRLPAVCPDRRGRIKVRFCWEISRKSSLPGPHGELTVFLSPFGRYCSHLRLYVDESSTFRSARDGSGGFLLVGLAPSIEVTVTMTGRGRGVIPRQVRVFGPGYNRSSKWLVAQ